MKILHIYEYNQSCSVVTGIQKQTNKKSMNPPCAFSNKKGNVGLPGQYNSLLAITIQHEYVYL